MSKSVPQRRRRLGAGVTFLSPDGDNNDDVASADEEGGNDEEGHRDEGHVQPPLPLCCKITIEISLITLMIIISK